MTKSEFWQGKTVVVTDGAGFIGSHLVDLLIDAGANVTIIDNLSRGQSVTSVAAFDAPAGGKSRADYVCDGVDDQDEIQVAMGAGVPISQWRHDGSSDIQPVDADSN